MGMHLHCRRISENQSDEERTMQQWAAFEKWFRRNWIMVLIIMTSLIIFGEGAQLALVVFNLSAIALVLLLTDFILDTRKDLGLFPTLDIDRAIDNAIKGDVVGRGPNYYRSPNPVACALIWLGFVILLLGILFLAVPSAHGAELDKARPYLPKLSQAIAKNWPDAPLRETFAGQVEQESQWNPKAHLNTSLEQGYGLGQITVTKNFNSFKDLKAYKVLRGWDIANDKYNVQYQLTALVLHDKDNFTTAKRLFAQDVDRMAAMLVGYNAGIGTVLQRHALAKITDPPAASKWFGGLDRIRLKYECRRLYGQDLGTMRNAYPREIIQVKAVKYKGLV